MNIANIKSCDIANGPGVRTSVFVAGCRHGCPGCFNQPAWDFHCGEPMDDSAVARIVEACRPDWIAGLSLLGGEPFEPENQPEVLRLARAFRRALPDRSIWCWTGFLFEELNGDMPSRGRTAVTGELLQALDVLVDGPFRQAEADITLRFRGSANQRILDLPRSLAEGRAVPWQSGETAVSSKHAGRPALQL